MRVVVQRVTWARVLVEGRNVGEVGPGLLLLVGIAAGDSAEAVAGLARKVAELRIFSDAAGRMNRSVLEVGGGALVVSQFTLLADCSRGRRPFFGQAEEPTRAKVLCEQFIADLRAAGVARVATGEFGAMMQVELCNDGPVTIILEA